MEKYSLSRAIACWVTILTLGSLQSCINEKYEVSEDNLDLNVTVFQEGVSLPLGSTVPITLESLYEMLDDETRQVLKQMSEGYYMFQISDRLDMTQDVADALAEIGPIEAVSFSESFSVDVSDVDLSGVEIPEQNIGPVDVPIVEKLSLPDINLDEIRMDVSIAPELPVSSQIDLDIPVLTVPSKTLELGQMPAVNTSMIPPGGYDVAMDYHTYVNYGLPEIDSSYPFDTYSIDVPLDIKLPSGIRSVESVTLNGDAYFEIKMEVINPFVTEGAVTPQLNLDFSEIFNVARIEKSAPAMSQENSWTVTHRYYLASLNVDRDGWMQGGKVTFAGSCELSNLKSTPSHLIACEGKVMQIKVDMAFSENMRVDDVVMEIEPLGMSESRTMDIKVGVDSPLILPQLVQKIDYICFDKEKPLKFELKADIPDELNALEITLKTLEIRFPKEMTVDREGNETGVYVEGEQYNVLTYTDIPVSGTWSDKIAVDRLVLPALEGNRLRYAGQVQVVAQAEASGKLTSKYLLDADREDIAINVSVDYLPEIIDFSVEVNDYDYVMDETVVQPIEISRSVGKEVGAAFGDKPVTVSLVQDAPDRLQQIVISLDYPDLGEMAILPMSGGLKIDFPDMINFTEESIAEYDIKADNSISFLDEEKEIPRKIVLDVESVSILPVYDEAADDYFIKDRMEVSGGITIRVQALDKNTVDQFLSPDAVIRLDAVIPRIAPAKLELGEYVASIPSQEFVIDGMSIDLPEMVSSLSVSEVSLKNVVLNLEVDAESLLGKLGNPDLTLDIDVALPKIIKVEGADDANVLHVKCVSDKSGKIVLDPVVVHGLDLSDVGMSEDGKLVVEQMKATVDAQVKIENLAVNIEDLSGETLEVSVSGAIATRDEEGMTDEIVIDRIVGNVGLEMEPVQTEIDLSSVAELLNGEDMSATIDINTFWLKLELETNIDIPVKGAVELVPHYGQTPGEPVSLEIALDPSKRVDGVYHILVSDKDPNAPDADARFEMFKDYVYLPLDIVSLLYRKDESQAQVMASSIKVSLNAGVDPDKECVLEPSKEYVLAMDYELGIPLELGEDFSLEYKGTISDLPEEASQLLAYGTLGLGGKITNGLPLRLHLQLTLMDSEGNTIPMAEGAGQMVIASCDSKGNPVTSEIDLVIGGIDTDFSDLHSIGFVLKADAKDAAGVPMRSDSYVQVSLAARIPDGLTLDLGSLLFESEEGTDE